VKIKGLLTKKELNGDIGIVTEWLEETGRWKMILEKNNKTKLSIRPQNLTLLDTNEPQLASFTLSKDTDVFPRLSKFPSAPERGAVWTTYDGSLRLHHMRDLYVILPFTWLENRSGG
jgi:hypothetical protein